MSDHKEKTDSERRDLQSILTEVMEVALSKYQKSRASNRDRMGWGRLIVSACEASAKILKDNDLDELRERVEALEKVKK